MIMNAIFAIVLLALSFGVHAVDKLPTVSKGVIERISYFESELVDSRSIYVWLPPGYSKTQKYDVLYMHDGDMLFDADITWNKQEWQLDEVAGALIEEKKVRPFIVVAIPNAGEKRHSEYYPQKPFEALTEKTQASMYQLKRDAENSLFKGQVYSDKYLAFLVTEVVPYIEARYPVKVGGNHRFLAGSSMGGLISWYGLMEYPKVFAGAISMSTHWPGAFGEDRTLFKSFLSYIDTNVPRLSRHKVYFDYGDKTLDAMYPPLQKKIDEIFKKNYPNTLWRSQFFPGEDHSERAWAKRLDVPLLFMFGQ